VAYSANCISRSCSDHILYILVYFVSLTCSLHPKLFAYTIQIPVVLSRHDMFMPFALCMPQTCHICGLNTLPSEEGARRCYQYLSSMAHSLSWVTKLRMPCRCRFGGRERERYRTGACKTWYSDEDAGPRFGQEFQPNCSTSSRQPGALWRKE
jgi:hypothetical protein